MSLFRYLPLFGLVGYPIEHSRSPLLFASSVLAKSGAMYQLFPLRDIRHLPALCKTYFPSGLNITSPYKTEVLSVFPHLKMSPEVQALSATNVLCLEYQEEEVFVRAYNTDVEGFIYGLTPYLTGKESTALILGTGGAARAADYALRSLGIKTYFVSRSGGDKAFNTYIGGNTERLKFYEGVDDILSISDIVVNATPLGRIDDTSPVLNYGLLSSNVLGYDLNYSEQISPFMQKIDDIGGRSLDGSAMLLGQAMATWRIWSETR